MPEGKQIIPKEFVFQWIITYQCNLKCVHCSNPQAVRREIEDVNTLYSFFEKYLDFIKVMKLDPNCSYVVFTGGEPLFVDKFYQLLERISPFQNRTRYILVTNGTLLDRNKLIFIKKHGIKAVHLSIEGLESLNKKIRGQDVGDIIERCKFLISEGIGVKVSFTVWQLNLKDMRRVIMKLTKNKIPANVRRLVPIGMAEGLKNNLLSPLQMRGVYRWIAQNKYLYDRVRVKYCDCDESLLALETKRLPIGYCLIKKGEKIALDPYGNIILCSLLPYKVTSLRRKTLLEAYLGAQEYIYNSTLVQECLACPLQEKCLGGSACLAYTFFKKLSPDPQCWRLFRKLPDNAD